MKPNPRNSCAGAYKDWLDVMLLPECQGHCAWCIEQGGFRPKVTVGWQARAKAILDSGLKQVLLLGGEPLLYPSLKPLLRALQDLDVYMTSNGGLLLDKPFLSSLKGLNLSIHHYDMGRNKSITGVDLTGIDQPGHKRYQFLQWLRSQGVSVRFNCNLIPGQVDSLEEATHYLEWSAPLSEAVKFVELRGKAENFVPAESIFGHLPTDPFQGGCFHEFEFQGRKVFVRQVCGFVPSGRETPPGAVPEITRTQQGKVLYPDGVIYDGWQTDKENEMESRRKVVSTPKTDTDRLMEMVQKFKEGMISEEALRAEIDLRTRVPDYEESQPRFRCH